MKPDDIIFRGLDIKEIRILPQEKTSVGGSDI